MKYLTEEMAPRMRFEFVPRVYDLHGVSRASRATVRSSVISFETVSVATWIPRLDYSLVFFGYNVDA